MVLPYVYKLTHKETGQFYIGFRCKNKVPSGQDLGFYYFSSSKSVKSIGFENFDVEIVAEFFDSDSAYDFENILISENFKDPLCLNEHFEKDGKRNFKSLGRKKSQKTRDKISKGNKGKVRSAEARLNYSKAMTGEKNPMFGNE